MKTKKALILLSGGLDSATCLAVTVSEGYRPYTVSFLYGQRHKVELECAKSLCEHYGIPREDQRVVELGLQLRGSALTGDAPVPEAPTDAPFPQTPHGAHIPVTYVPGRNLVFLSLAASIAESEGISDIFIGVNSLDYSGYPDCRPEFISALTTTINLGTKAGVEGRPFRILTPLQRLTKKEIIRLGVALGVPFQLTHSCYMGVRPACGKCDSCRLRLKGFKEAGVADPIPYAQS